MPNSERQRLLRLFGRNEPGLHHFRNAHRRGLNLPLLQLESA